MTIAALLLWVGPFFGLPFVPSQTSPPRFVVRVLGTAQDGGYPQLGCEAACCALARAHPERARLRTCLGVEDRTTRKLLLIEATQDIERQVSDLLHAADVSGRGRNPVDAVLVTHAHVGHYLGLLSFGRETAASRAMPLHCTPRFQKFLESSPPFELLVSAGHVAPHAIDLEHSFEPIPGLEVQAIPVPHRDEFSDTVAFVLRGPRHSLLFLPDIDRWEKWDHKIEEVVRSVDYALLDGTFYDAGEIPGRKIEDIPHPLVPATVARLSALAGERRGQIAFIHLNHTNRLLTDEAAVRALEEQGFKVAREGDVWEL